MMPVGRGGTAREGLAESFANVRTSGPSGPTNPQSERRGGGEVERLTVGPFAFLLSPFACFILPPFERCSFRFEMHLLTLKRSAKINFRMNSGIKLDLIRRSRTFHLAPSTVDSPFARDNIRRWPNFIVESHEHRVIPRIPNSAVHTSCDLFIHAFQFFFNNFLSPSLFFALRKRTTRNVLC